MGNDRFDKLDTGVEFKPYYSTFISNQYSAYILAHLEFIFLPFPEIK